MVEDHREARGTKATERRQGGEAARRWALAWRSIKSMDGGKPRWEMTGHGGWQRKQRKQEEERQREAQKKKERIILFSALGVIALLLVLLILLLVKGKTPPTADPPAPSKTVTAAPTTAPTAAPTAIPTAVPTAEPTATPTAAPTATPTAAPTATPVPNFHPETAIGKAYYDHEINGTEYSVKDVLELVSLTYYDRYNKETQRYNPGHKKTTVTKEGYPYVYKFYTGDGYIYYVELQNDSKDILVKLYYWGDEIIGCRDYRGSDSSLYKKGSQQCSEIASEFSYVYALGG